jgi:alpha-1,2-mannosyltransferase
MATSSIVAALAVVPLLPLILIFLVQLLLRALGWYLLAQTTARKAAITTRVRAEQAALTEHQESQGEDDGWEKIEESGTAENGKSLQDDWSGVVGFFHPFWCVLPANASPGH